MKYVRSVITRNHSQVAGTRVVCRRGETEIHILVYDMDGDSSHNRIKGFKLFAFQS
jgi:hypothetical protein